MRRTQIIQRVRQNTRDFSNSIFREQDIIDFINEGIDRIRQYIPELRNMTHLLAPQQVPNLLPPQYHHLIAVYATARCFSQDERHYQATTYMNEFEVKLDELKSNIESGNIVIVDEDGKRVVNDIDVDYVDLTAYWGRPRRDRGDFDKGVEGVSG